MTVKVYTNGAQTSIGRHVLSFKPYVFKGLFKENELDQFLGPDGKPMTIHIEFMNGVAEVSDKMAAILTRKEINLASKSREVDYYRAPALNPAAIAASI